MCSEVHYVDEEKRKSGNAIRVWGQGGREDGLSRRVLEILLARASQAEGKPRERWTEKEAETLFYWFQWVPGGLRIMPRNPDTYLFLSCFSASKRETLTDGWTLLARGYPWEPISLKAREVSNTTRR